MRKIWQVVGLASCGLFMVGCGEAGPGEEPSANVGGVSERSLIEGYLASRGIVRERLAFEEDRVRLDQDAYFDKTSLLDEIAFTGYDPSPHQQPQGYYYKSDSEFGRNASPRALGTYFKFTAAVPTAWRDSIRHAALIWGSLSSTDCVSFIEGTAPNSGISQITIGVGDLGNSDSGQPAAASAEFPVLFAPPHAGFHIITGRKLTIDRDSVNLADESRRLAIALHELGHSLGFMHPWKGVRIAGTQKNTGSLINDADECCLASYHTIMAYGDDTMVTGDDIQALAVRFKKQTLILPHSTLVTCNYVP